MGSVKSPEVLATELSNLTKEVGELKAQFVMFQSSFVRSDLYTLKHNEIERDVQSVRLQVQALKNFRWFLVLASSVIGGLFAFLLQYTLTH